MLNYYLKLSAVICLLGFASLANSAPLEVFVSILPQQYLVERIGGDQVNVNVMVKPGQSPETFDPSPKLMSKYSRADVYFTIGLPFEQVWIGRVASLNNTARIIKTQPDFSQHKEQGIALGDHHHDWDPHTWLSPRLFLQQAKIVLQGLNSLSPDKKQYFVNNYNKLALEVKALDEEFVKLFQGKSGQHFITFHPAFSYFANQYGLIQIAIEIDGKEPSAKQIAQVINRIRDNKVAYILIEKQFNQTIPQTIAQSVGARLLELDPLARDYLVNMRDIADKINRALF